MVVNFGPLTQRKSATSTQWKSEVQIFYGPLALALQEDVLSFRGFADVLVTIQDTDGNGEVTTFQPYDAEEELP